MLRNWWAGAGIVTFFALGHMWDATPVMGVVGVMTFMHLRTCEMGWGWWRSLHLHTCEMLRNWWAGAGIVTFFAFAHMWDATPVMGVVGMMTFMHLRTCEMGVRRGDSDVLCTCTHVRCSATDGLGWGWWRSLRLDTCEMLRQWWGWWGRWDAPQVMGWGGDDDIHALAHMWDIPSTTEGLKWLTHRDRRTEGLKWVNLPM